MTSYSQQIFPKNDDPIYLYTNAFDSGWCVLLLFQRDREPSWLMVKLGIAYSIHAAEGEQIDVQVDKRCYPIKWYIGYGGLTQ